MVIYEVVLVWKTDVMLLDVVPPFVTDTCKPLRSVEFEKLEDIPLIKPSRRHPSIPPLVFLNGILESLTLPIELLRPFLLGILDEVQDGMSAEWVHFE